MRPQDRVVINSQNLHSNCERHVVLAQGTLAQCVNVLQLSLFQAFRAK